MSRPAQPAMNDTAHAARETRLQVKFLECVPPGRLGPLPVVAARVTLADATVLPVDPEVFEFRHDDYRVAVEDLTQRMVPHSVLIAAVTYALMLYLVDLDGHHNSPVHTCRCVGLTAY